MLGRCRMRRGVSLEVIVEEDDNAEVSFDPVPLIEEPDDQDDDSETGTGSSATSSPRDEDDEDRDSEEREEGISSSAEERRRKRDRRRTIGGLSRFRSVSCEALTLLDTSDMDSCCSEWDDSDDLASSSNGNYVTLNRPISRRRIIQNIHSQCDSEDSGFEYHSNEDDHLLEDQSSNDDHVDDAEEEEEREELREDEEPKMERDGEETMYQREDDETTITTESDDEEEDGSQIQINDHQTVGGDPKPNSRARNGFSADQLWQQNSIDEAVQTPKFAYSPNEALENDKIIIVETTSPVPIKKQQSTKDAAEEEMKLKREAYTIRNKEVRLAELPRPDTVKSVKQLFENLKTPVQHFHTWRDLGRFRDIKSNPSSKILRFDRNDGNDSLGSHRPFMSLTLPRLPSQGGLPNTHSPANPTATKGRKEIGKEASNAKRPTGKYPETPMSAILTQFIAQRGSKGEGEDTKLKNKHNQIPRQVKTQSGQRVILRKPIVKGFNVKRALMENPRNFLPHDHNTKNQKQQQKSNNNFNLKQAHIHKSHHHRDVTDKSDTESLASDISEDSGVSNDSLASTASSGHFSYRALDAYASDPSFKWIDPSVMAKIRAVGTTVIFFGPRQRPKQEGTLPRGTTSISSGLKVNHSPSANHSCQNSRTRHPNRTPASPHHEKTNMPIPAPRIVGVVRKQSSSSVSEFSQPSINNKSSATPPPTEIHPDSTQPSSPITRCADDTTPGKKGRWRAESDTVVYNFTKPQPPAVYF